jgi:general secretion pathway protein N
VAVGALAGVLAFAPAAWFAGALSEATGERLLLADARGTVWSGSAVPVLTAGPGSRDATTLPGRLAWTLAPRGMAFELRLRQPCCLNGELPLRIEAGFARLRVVLSPAEGGAAARGQWPASWLSGLGTPWNTLQLAGTLRLSSPGLTLERVQGRWRLAGQADVDVDGVSSRLSTLPVLGSYRLGLLGEGGSGAALLELTTRSGDLQLSGRGEWGAQLRFRGQAQAADGAEAALANLLNIIGQRQGALSVISIG